jgi:pimeloyl-ACP methyl ester carboxylesterase
MKAEIRAALAYLRSREDVAGDRLAIAGHGQGGFLAAETLGAAGAAEGVRALALLAPPARSLRDTLVARLRARLGSDPAVSQSALAVAEADLQADLDRVRDLGPDVDPGPGARLLRDLLPLVPSDTYVRDGLPPTLVVYGESDHEIPAAFRGMLGSAISLQGKGRVRMQTVFSADHQFLETDGDPQRDDVARRRHPALAEYVRRFLEANLR